MGSQFVETNMIFDTMSTMITVNLKRCEGASLSSHYDFNTTETEKAVYYKTSDGEYDVYQKLTGVFHYRDTVMQGDFFKD